MTKVFIGGSREVSRLPSEVCARLDRIVEQSFPVVVGDANGADKAVQQYLHAKGYRNVEVFCSGNTCRNNVGGWPLRVVDASSSKRDRRFYTAKDLVMAREATAGLMVWNGTSAGTLLNVVRLVQQSKVAVVFNTRARQFAEVRSEADWKSLVAGCPPQLKQQVEKEQAAEVVQATRPAQAHLW